MGHVKAFNMSLAQISSPNPATERVLVERRVTGELFISSTTEQEGTIQILDQAMEAIDGQRLPVEDTRR